MREAFSYPYTNLYTDADMIKLCQPSVRHWCREIQFAGGCKWVTLDISHRALSERLQRATSNLIENTIVDETDEEWTDLVHSVGGPLDVVSAEIIANSSVLCRVTAQSRHR
jgi:hypothetical protein